MPAKFHPLLLSLTAILAAGGLTGVAVATPSSVQVAPAAPSGSFSALTYNVAGLPEGLSSGSPAANTTTIGARLGGYDLVNVQEDFNYHADLYATDTHAYRTPTSGGAGIGSGLNTLSDHPYSDLDRVTWSDCNGTDCLTPKGFTWMRIRIAEGVYLDAYNLHPNAGTTDADLAARRANIAQLSTYITANSAGNAVIVAGDTNTRYTRTGDNIRLLGTANGLSDVWVQQAMGGVPPAQGSAALVCDAMAPTNTCEVVDKILYRGSRYLVLTPTFYANAHAAFLDADGASLSDHDPITARFNWTVNAGLRMSDLHGGPHRTPFTDVATVPVGEAVTAVSIRSGSRVDQVAITLAGGVRYTHGGTGGTASSLALATGEHITAVTLDAGQKDGRTRIFHIRLTTNLGRSLAGGTPTGDSVTYTAPAGWQVSGFHGRCGDEIDKLGLIYTPIS